MAINYSTQTDQKHRWAGLLENPYLSKVHRNLLDGFKVRNLTKTLKSFEFKNLLDVCCGYGEYYHMNKGQYVGLDNTFSRVKFAKGRLDAFFFTCADATKLPFKDNTFEAVLHAGSAHHFSDEQFKQFFQEMKRVSSLYVIVADIVLTPQQGRLRRFFYSLDRGTRMRTVGEFEEILSTNRDQKLIMQAKHRTSPGIYTHALFVFEVDKAPKGGC